MDNGTTHFETSLIENPIRDNAVLANDSAVISSPTSSAASIVSAANMHFTSAENYLTLIYRTVIAAFNELFDDEVNSPPLDTTRDKNWDSSAEAISSQIMASITPEYVHFYDSHAELSEEAVLLRFIHLTSASFELARNELREILEDHEMLDTEYAALTEDTFECLSESLNDFNNSFGYADTITAEDLFDDDDSFHLDQWPEETSPPFLMD